MPINPAIAMSFQAPKFEDPMNNLIKMEQIKAYQQNALAKQLEAEVAQESLGQQRGLSNYLAGLEPGASPDMNMLARFGKTGREYGKDIAEAQSKQMEMASKLYKEMYLPILGQAKTRDDVLAWHGSMEQDPRLKGFLTPQGKAMLPKSDAEVPSYLESVFVPFQERNKPIAVSKGGAIYIPGEGMVTAPTGPEEPQKPFAVGGFVFDPETRTFMPPPETKEPTKPTDLMIEYDKAKEEGSFKGTFTDFKREFGVKGKGAGAGGLTATQAEKEKTKAIAREGIDNVLDEVDNALDGLRGLGEIRETGAGFFRNIKASALSSETGQKYIGKPFATPGQAYRDRINFIKPLFTSQLVQATGMGSKSLDSNKELQLFLNTINDPSVDYLVAKSQVELIRKIFGSGAQIKTQQDLTNAMKVVNSIAKNEKIETQPSGESATLKIPQAAIDMGVTPEIYRAMTPEERATFEPVEGE